MFWKVKQQSLFVDDAYFNITCERTKQVKLVTTVTNPKNLLIQYRTKYNFKNFRNIDDSSSLYIRNIFSHSRFDLALNTITPQPQPHLILKLHVLIPVLYDLFPLRRAKWYPDSQPSNVCSSYVMLCENWRSRKCHFIVFGLTRLGLEPIIYRTRGDFALPLYHYCGATLKKNKVFKRYSSL